MFTAEFGLLEDLGYFPGLALETGEEIPMSVSTLLGHSIDRHRINLGPRGWTLRRRELLVRVDKALASRQVGGKGTPKVVALPRQSAYAAVRAQLAAFIAFRFKSVSSILRQGSDSAGGWQEIAAEQRIGGEEVQTPGCLFKAETQSPGLTVLWSAAFFIAPNYFGAPSTPVFKLVQAGRYKFGVSGPTGGPQWDHNALVTVPTANSVYLHY